MPFDTLITNATVVDGTNSPRYGADVGLDGGNIAAIGSLGEADAERRIDASGLVLAPGFIDMHTHSDLTLLDDPGGEAPRNGFAVVQPSVHVIYKETEMPFDTLITNATVVDGTNSPPIRGGCRTRRWEYSRDRFTA